MTDWMVACLGIEEKNKVKEEQLQHDGFTTVTSIHQS